MFHRKELNLAGTARMYRLHEVRSPVSLKMCTTVDRLIKRRQKSSFSFLNTALSKWLFGWNLGDCLGTRVFATGNSMEVTKTNFEEILPLVEESVFSCDFVAIDCEFTGTSLKIKHQ